MISIPVYNIDGKEVEKVKLDKEVFDGKVKKEVLHQAVRMYRANQRFGAAFTKTRGEVSGGGRKPWKQKGTGRARAGSIRSPIWRGGGITFGPRARDYSYRLPKKIKQAAFKYSVNDKVNNNKIIVIDQLKIEEPKTKVFASILDKLKISGKVLLLLEKIDSNIVRSSRNIPRVSIKQLSVSSTYDLLVHENIMITKAGLEALTERMKL